MRSLSDRRLPMRAIRWVLQRFAVWANSAARHIPASALEGIRVYHSPLHPIPEVVCKRRTVKQFLTVVDVIPLSNPESVNGRGIRLLRKQLDSISSDQFIFAISDTVKSDLLQIKEIAETHVFVTPLAASP